MRDVPAVLRYLSTFLREAASGYVLFVGLWAAGDGSVIKEIKDSFDMSFWPFVVVGPIIGFALYAIHRSTIQPLMYWLFHRSRMGEIRKLRWTLRYGDDKNKAAIMRELDGWSALTDYLYTSAWALVAATILLRVSGELHPNDETVWGVAAVLFAFALVGDIQVLSAELNMLP
jgi:hypothetical protein